MRQVHQFSYIIGRGAAMRTLLLITLLTCFISAPSSAADIKVTAKLEPARFSEDQASRFVVTVNGAQSAEPDMPAADGLHFVYQGKSSQASWVNGKISASISFNFIVQAEKSGEFTIAPVNMTVGGKVYTSEPVSCTVLPVLPVQKSGSQAAASASAKGIAASGVQPGAAEAKKIGFMRIIPETERMYSGQVIAFILKAYFRSGKRVTLKSAPHLNGEDFLLQSLDEEPVQQQERVKGITYTSLTWQGTLSAVKEGTVSLSAAMDAEVLVRSKSRLRGSPFASSLLDDPFFGVLGNYSRRDITVSSPEKTVSVLDLPTEKRPDDFSGAIGTFSLAVTASPLDGKIGEPISMKMQLDGSGNFTSFQAPILTEEQGWKIYPASETIKDLGGGKGEKTFEQALIPAEQGLIVVPAVRFSYFDPKSEEYVTLNSDPIPLHLRAADEDIPAPGNSGSTLARLVPQRENKARKNLVAGPEQHLAPLKPESGKLLSAVQPVYEKLWFRLLVLTALLCVLLSFVLFLRQRKLAKDPSILWRRKVQVRLAEQYKGMKQALAIQDQEAFHRHCRVAVQEGTGGAWGLAPEAVTLADLEQRLPTEAPLRTVFARLEQSGYSGEQLLRADLEEILQTVKKELDKLV